MPYDFDTIINRRGTNSIKWSVNDNELPMWVADMDFPTCPAIVEAVQAKVDHGIYGYEVVPPEYAQAIILWWGSRYGVTLEPEWIHFCDGVVPAISSLIRTFTEPGDGVLIQSPVYDAFYSSISHSDRRIVTSDLPYLPTLDSSMNPFGIDWVDMEAKLSDPSTKILLLCNPHNPTGQLWTPEELTRISALARTHHVLVIADEIHCDITQPSTKYTPFSLVDSDSITVISPSKSFNIPGLQGAAIVVPDPDLMTKAKSGLNRDGICQAGSFATIATIAAYTQGADWLDSMRSYVWANRSHLENFIADNLPQLRVIPSQSTYLAWVDCSQVTDDSLAFTRYLREATGLVLNPGTIYGANAHTFVRINLACAAVVLEDGLNRLLRAVRGWELADRW